MTEPTMVDPADVPEGALVQILALDAEDLGWVPVMAIGADPAAVLVESLRLVQDDATKVKLDQGDDRADWVQYMVMMIGEDGTEPMSPPLYLPKSGHERLINGIMSVKQADWEFHVAPDRLAELCTILRAAKAHAEGGDSPSLSTDEVAD